MPRKKATSTKTKKPGRKAAKPKATSSAPKTKARSSAKPKASKGHGGSAPGSFKCPDCDFVAKHAMGLGRHRSARHGTLSKRAQRQAAAGSAPKRRGRPPKTATAGVPATPTGVATPPAGWITRRQAAALGGVHYNTVRLWERAKLFKTQQRDRDVLIDEAGFRTTLSRKKASPKGRPLGAKTGTRAAATPSASSFEASEMLARLDALADGLEALARQVRPRKRRGRPPKR
jgi:hypothetical protein